VPLGLGGVCVLAYERIALVAEVRDLQSTLIRRIERDPVKTAQPVHSNWRRCGRRYRLARVAGMASAEAEVRCLRLSQHLGDLPKPRSEGEYFTRCKIADEWRGIAIMIKIKFISKLALTLAAGCLSVGMLGVDASAQPPTPLITVIIGDNLSLKNVGLGVAAKVLVSDVCGVDERDAKEILELAATNNQKIVAICPRTGAIFHVVP
jgi:hypothetical protein